jgi:protein-disulfide isomerase
MSRKSRRNRVAQSTPETNPTAPSKPGSRSRWSLVLGTLVVVLIVYGLGSLLFGSKGTRPAQPAPALEAAALASEGAPTVGDPGAKVHIVEFLDPACETCALFYPLVKRLVAENPGRIRLSTRHVTFHDGSEYVVRLLEASRRQDRYWQTLEALLGTQAQWAPNHTVQPELVWQAIGRLGLDRDQVLADMNAPEITARLDRDLSDAKALRVTATPEYFVNGRPLPSFGDRQLIELVREELQKAYALE